MLKLHSDIYSRARNMNNEYDGVNLDECRTFMELQGWKFENRGPNLRITHKDKKGYYYVLFPFYDPPQENTDPGTPTKSDYAFWHLFKFACGFECCEKMVYDGKISENFFRTGSALELTKNKALYRMFKEEGIIDDMQKNSQFNNLFGSE